MYHEVVSCVGREPWLGGVVSDYEGASPLFGRVVHCARGVRQFFDVPEGAKLLWFTVSTEPSDEAIECYLEAYRTWSDDPEDERRVGGAHVVPIDDYAGPSYHFASARIERLASRGLDIGDKLWVSCEYEEVI